MLNWIKKILRIKDKTIFDQPFLVARRPSIKIADGETIDIEVICPACQSHWADATVTFGGPITPENFRVRDPFVKATKIDENKQLVCPACGWGYTVWAIQAAILAAQNRSNFTHKQSENTKVYGQSEGANG